MAPYEQQDTLDLRDHLTVLHPRSLNVRRTREPAPDRDRLRSVIRPGPLAVLLAAVLLLGAGGCAPGDGRVEWRDLSLEVPDGWVVAERDEQKLSLANTGFGPDRGEELEAAVFLTHEPGASIDRWRDLVADGEGDVESDRTVDVGGEPASRLVFLHDANGTLLREMVVVVPSRDVVMLFQPVVPRDSRDGPEVFDRHRERFERVLASLRFGDAGGGDAPPDLSTGGRRA